MDRIKTDYFFNYEYQKDTICDYPNSKDNGRYEPTIWLSVLFHHLDDFQKALDCNQSIGTSQLNAG